MYSVNAETKNAYKSDTSHKEIVIRIPGADLTLTNEDIVAESLELKESIESSGNLSFQGCNAASFKIECFNLVDDTIEGKWIEADITADETQTIPLFRGYIKEVTNPTHEEFTTEIRAYDALYTINNMDVTAWYNSLTFPITVLSLRNSFFQYVGVTQVPDYLPNDGITVQKSIEDKVIMGATIIKAICQLNGRFGRISRTGLFEYVHLVEGTEALYPREDLYPDDEIYPADENALDNILKAHYKDIAFENYRVAVISKVQLINKDGQIAATSGNGNNIFTLKDNPLIWGLSQTALNAVATNLYNTIQGLWYTPAQVECVGLPYVECGDFILMSARLSIVRAYVLSRTLKGIQVLDDSFSAEGDRMQPVYVPDIQTQTNANAHNISAETTRATTAERAEANTRQSQINTEASTRQNQINAVNVRCDNLNTRAANIESLVATKASISDLSAANARIDNLSASKANISDLNATNANVNNLSARVANVQNLVASKASIADLNARLAGGYAASFTSVTCQQLRLGGTNYSGSVRVVTTYHAYDCIGNQVY
jgi:hypothetical protein